MFDHIKYMIGQCFLALSESSSLADVYIVIVNCIEINTLLTNWPNVDHTVFQ